MYTVSDVEPQLQSTTEGIRAIRRGGIRVGRADTQVEAIVKCASICKERAVGIRKYIHFFGVFGLAVRDVPDYRCRISLQAIEGRGPILSRMLYSFQLLH